MGLMLTSRGGRATRGAPRGKRSGCVRYALVESSLADGANLVDAGEEDIGRGEESEAGVMMLLVVPAEEGAEPSARMHFAEKASGIVGLILECLELRFAEGVVIGYVGAD